MKKQYIELYKEFNRIRNLGWIKTMRNGTTGVGYTFESLLNKKEDNLKQPDFNGIEIKTMKYFSKKKIHLFNLTPDSDTPQSIKSIVEKFGYPDKEYPMYKVFNISINAKEYTKIGYKKYKLSVNEKEKKIDLIASTIFGFKININIYWPYEKLQDSLEKKLKILAIVKACSKKENNTEYYYYTRIDFYELKEFDYFIHLIKEGIINITFKIGIRKDLEKLGNIHDKGTDFSMFEKDIELLFKKQ